MLNHLLISFALLSFSVVSDAAAVPMDVNQTALVAAPNAVLPSEGGMSQGGGSDRDVAEALMAVTTVGCQSDVTCTDIAAALDAPQAGTNHPIQFAAPDESSALQPFIVLLVILAVIVIFLSRKSESTK